MKSFVVIIMIFAFIVVTYSNISMMRLNKRMDYTLSIKSDSIQMLENNIKNISTKKTYEIASEGITLSQNVQFYDEFGQMSRLVDIVDETTLFFRFSNTNCSACYEQNLIMIDSLTSVFEINNVVLVGSFNHYNVLTVIKNANQVSFPIFNVKNDFPFPIEDINNPYFFIIDNNYVCRRFFAPLKEIPNLTMDYFHMLHKFK